MAANPFGRRVNDNVSAVIDGADKVAASAEGVVNLRMVNTKKLL